MFLDYILYFYMFFSDPCAFVTDIVSILISILFHLIFKKLPYEINSQTVIAFMFCYNDLDALSIVF